MQSTKTIHFHAKPQPRPLYKFEDLYTSEQETSFKGLRVPIDAELKLVHFGVDVNKWSLAHTFNFDNQIYAIPTFLGNDPALMFTWEFRVDVEKEPTSAWRGKYSVWYHEKAGEAAFYLFKQRKGGNATGESVLHDNVPWPGRHEKSWLGKELDKIMKVLKKARSDGQWNPPLGTAGLTVDCVV